AEAVARLQHPNIIQLYEGGEHDGLPFFSLEFVECGTLDRQLAGKSIPQEEAAPLVEQLPPAMHYAPPRRVIHPDLTPANILLASCGRAADDPQSKTVYYNPKIADFGLAKQLDSRNDLSHTGAILGTPTYMAPEQAEGRTRDIGPTTDVYALGVI